MINLKVLLIILFAELLGISGQILYKKTVTKAGTADLGDLRSVVSFLGRFSVPFPRLWCGFRRCHGG